MFSFSTILFLDLSFISFIIQFNIPMSLPKCIISKTSTPFPLHRVHPILKHATPTGLRWFSVLILISKTVSPQIAYHSRQLCSFNQSVLPPSCPLRKLWTSAFSLLLTPLHSGLLSATLLPSPPITPIIHSNHFTHSSLLFY